MTYEHTEIWEAPMSAEMFRSLNDAGVLTPKRIAYILKQDVTSGYRWLTDYDPRLSQYCAVFSFCESMEAQRQMLELLTTGTRWVHEYLPANLDIDGNGEVDTNDIFAALTQALRNLADGVDALRTTGLPSQRITPSQSEELFKDFSEALSFLLAGRRCLKYLTSPSRRDTCS